MRKDEIPNWQFCQGLPSKPIDETVELKAVPASEVATVDWFEDFQLKQQAPFDLRWQIPSEPESEYKPEKQPNKRLLEYRELFAAANKRRVRRAKRARVSDAKARPLKVQRRELSQALVRYFAGDKAITEDRARYAALASQRKPIIARFDDWGVWVNCDERRIALLKSQDRAAISQLKDWKGWATTADRRIQLLKSEAASAVNEFDDWGQWANTDDRKMQLLRSRCQRAIKQVKDWRSFVTTDKRRLQVLRSRARCVIRQFDDWHLWANTTERLRLVNGNCPGLLRKAPLLSASGLFSPLALQPVKIKAAASDERVAAAMAYLK